MNKYSSKEGSYKGNPVMEVLINGDIWGSEFNYDEHFRFGRRKAMLIDVAMDLIEEFYNSDGRKPPLEDPKEIYELKYGMKVICNRHDEFTISNGKTIENPYLELKASDTSISFGLQKARALLDLEEEIKRFINRYS